MISIEFEANKSQCLHCFKKDKALYDLRIGSLSLSLCSACLNEIKQKIDNTNEYGEQKMIPERECENCGWQGEPNELIDNCCPECGKADSIVDYEDIEENTIDDK